MDPKDIKIYELKKSVSELEYELKKSVSELESELAALRQLIEDSPEIEFRFGRSGTEYVLKSGTALVYRTYKLVEVAE